MEPPGRRAATDPGHFQHGPDQAFGGGAQHHPAASQLSAAPQHWSRVAAGFVETTGRVAAGLVVTDSELPTQERRSGGEATSPGMTTSSLSIRSAPDHEQMGRIYLYHATPTKNIASILEGGLEPRAGVLRDHRWPPRVWFSDGRNLAYWWALSLLTRGEWDGEVSQDGLEGGDLWKLQNNEWRSVRKTDGLSIIKVLRPEGAYQTDFLIPYQDIMVRKINGEPPGHPKPSRQRRSSLSSLSTGSISTRRSSDDILAAPLPHPGCDVTKYHRSCRYLAKMGASKA